MAKDEKKDVTVAINGTDYPFTKDDVSFDEIVKKAFGEGANPADGYRVTYDRGHGNASGALAYGANIKLKDGMSFTVTGTGLS